MIITLSHTHNHRTRSF